MDIASSSSRQPALDPLLLLQLADSAFPTGGFAHSAGLEAALGHGFVRTPGELTSAVSSLLWTAGTLSLPYVRAAHDVPGDAPALALLHDTQLSTRVTNHASRSQGRALLDAMVKTFALPEHGHLRRACDEAGAPLHLAPLFGACFGIATASLDDTRRLFLFTTLRGAVGAAVRLNVVGPFEGQRIQASLVPLINGILSRTLRLRVADAASSSPVWDVICGTHDRLRTRLFQSLPRPA